MATPIPENHLALTTAGVAASTGGTIARGQGAHVGITSDSRAVRPGSVFVALRGERFDGHAFLAAAVGAGATLLVVERGQAVPGVADVVEVDDTLLAWGAIAREHRKAWSKEAGERVGTSVRKNVGKKLVAVTGSAGKTTTRGLCAALLATAGDVHATRGNLNNRIGVPATLFALPMSADFAVIEVGTSLKGEIAHLAAIALPDVGIITNVGLAHAEGLGSGRGAAAARSAVGVEKGSLFEALPEDGCAVVNADDDEVRKQVARTRARQRVHFGRAGGAEYRLLDRSGTEIRFTRPSASGPIRMRMPVLGEGFAIDFLAALAAAEAACARPLDLSDIEAALSHFQPAEGRAKVVRRADGALVIDDSYNANPLSMTQSIDMTVEMARAERRRPMVVLGEMRELGAAAEEAHADLGDYLAAAGVALAIGCGGLVAHTLDRAENKGVTVLRADDTAVAAALAVRHVGPDDVVLVKGSRGVQTERVVQALLEKDS